MGVRAIPGLLGRSRVGDICAGGATRGNLTGARRQAYVFRFAPHAWHNGRMPRAIWSGSISFGLVNVPVKLVTATAPKDVRFHQLHSSDGGRINQKRVCSVDGEEVEFSEIVKGYEIHRGQYVIVDPEELEALTPESSRSIDIAEVSTRSFPAAHTGAPMFSVQMIINVPSRIHVAHLREEFMEFCDSLNLDAILEPVKA